MKCVGSGLTLYSDGKPERITMGRCPHCTLMVTLLWVPSNTGGSAWNLAPHDAEGEQP